MIKKHTQMTRLQYIGYKYGTVSFFSNIAWAALRLFLLLGISCIIIYPLIIRVSASLMSTSDILDKTVLLVPKNFTLDNFKIVIRESGFWSALLNNSLLSFIAAALQTLTAVCVGYGLAKFKFRARKLVMIALVLVLIVPPPTIYTSLFLQFRFFDIFGLFSLFGSYVNMTDTLWPTIILSSTGLALKNGLFILMMRQFFMGVPDEMLEAAYIDGAGVYRTFAKIIMPLSVSQAVTIFLISFAWQWTDCFYSPIFYSDFKVLPNILTTLNAQWNVLTKNIESQAQEFTMSVYINAALLLIIVPLIIVYVFAQKFITQGVERSGLTG